MIEVRSLSMYVFDTVTLAPACMLGFERTSMVGGAKVGARNHGRACPSTCLAFHFCSRFSADLLSCEHPAQRKHLLDNMADEG